MATYLAFFAAGQFRTRAQRTADGRPYVYAVSELLGATGRADGRCDMLRDDAARSWRGWRTQFGHYPFTRSAGVVAGVAARLRAGDATRPVYPYVGGPDGRATSRCVVHEQAHQWFGDDVAVRRWRDIWLNEGFATYAEWA